MLTYHFGLVSDFLSACWNQLRSQVRGSTLEGRGQFGGALSGRDTTAVRRTVSGLLKLVYPNPKCECTNVVVTFIEEGMEGRPHSHCLQFGVELDINTWKMGELYDATAASNPLIQEFAGSLTEELKNNIRIKHRTFRQAVVAEARFRVPATAVREGHMACPEEIFGLSQEPEACGLILPLLVEYKGSHFRILDFYCMNPSCKCGEVHLSVGQVDRKGVAATKTEPLITARLHFEGKVELKDITGSIPRQDAVKFVSEWLRKNPTAIVEIEERYRRIKAVGKRLLKRR